MPAVLSQEFAIDFSRHFPRKNQSHFVSDVHHKNVREEFCDGSQWDPSQKCGCAFSFGTEFCDGFSYSFPKRNPSQKKIKVHSQNARHPQPRILRLICQCFSKEKSIAQSLRSITKCPQKCGFVFSFSKKNVMNFPIHVQKKKTIAKFPEVDHKNVPEEFCDGSQWDPSQKCGLVISSSKEFCDGLSNACPRKNPPHFFKNPFAKCLPPSAKNFVMDPSGIHHKNLALPLDVYGFQTLAAVPSKNGAKSNIL